MKPSVATAMIIAAIAALIAGIAYLGASYINILPAQASAASPGSAKDYLTTIVVAAIGGLLLAMLVLLVPDRWRRIESEVLSLRHGQDKALEDLRKRADERIAEKLDSASRQAQGILDHVTGLSERFPWIKGISEIGFAPNANACQLVLRNAAKLVATGQGMLAHEYLYSWVRDKKPELPLVGSSYDFMQMAAFAQLILADDYLATLLVGAGYMHRQNQLLLAAFHLRALSRHGMLFEAIDVAEAIRRRALPTWRERLREMWFAARRFGKPTVRSLRPTTEDCSALAVYFGVLGDEEEFGRALARGENLGVTPRDKLALSIAKAEGLAALGRLDPASEVADKISATEAESEGMAYELAWVLRRCARYQKAKELLVGSSGRALQRLQIDFGNDEDSEVLPTREPVAEQTVNSHGVSVENEVAAETSRSSELSVNLSDDSRNPSRS